MIPGTWLVEAERRIAPYIQPTPLTYDASLDIYLKWENRQVTGSFKSRGALNKVLALSTWERDRGLVAASAGNHGQGVALAARATGARAIIFASEHAVPAKIEAMNRLGAEVRLVPGGYGEAEQTGLAYAQESGSIWVSPYNDGQVIAGQGTLGLEILRELPTRMHTTWVVPVGGGGLIAGLGAAIRSAADIVPSYSPARLIGVQSEASPFFHSIFHSNTQNDVQEFPSLADGLAGPVEANSLTIPLVRSLVNEMLLVSETEIEQAVLAAWQRYQERIEGSAAAALAAVLSGKISSRPVVVVITGGNIDPGLFARLTGKPPG